MPTRSCTATTAGAREQVPRACPECGSVELARIGAGTQRLETELERRLPELERFRLDADVSGRGGAVRDVLERFGSADRAVLVGTQMVAKGHHLPGVALAAVVDADTGLSLPDFRAEERTFQLVTQLAGRSGRDAPGRVLVQTFQPDATPLRHAVNHDVAGFLAGELERREALGYPPFRHLVSILVAGPEPGAPLAALRELRERLETDGVDAVLLGPAPVLRLRRAPQGAADREDDAAPSARPSGIGAPRRGGANDAAGRADGRRRRRPPVAVERTRMDERVTAMIREAMPLAALLGFEGVEGSPEAVVVRGAWAPERCTAAGVLHGGYLMSLADVAAATLAFLNLQPGATTATIEAKTNFLAAVREGSVTARAELVHAGRMTIVVQVDVRDEAGRLVSRTLQTQAVIGPAEG